MSNTMLNNVIAKIKSAPKTPPVVILILALIIAGGAVLLQKTDGGCQQAYRLDTTIGGAKQEIRAEIAADDVAREKGLSGRQCIPDGVGMMFSFDKPGSYGFWMKDMRFPIDMVWLDSDRQVVTIVQNAQPGSYPKTFTSSLPAQYVLELGSGQAQALGIKTGSRLNF